MHSFGNWLFIIMYKLFKYTLHIQIKSRNTNTHSRSLQDWTYAYILLLVAVVNEPVPQLVFFIHPHKYWGFADIFKNAICLRNWYSLIFAHKLTQNSYFWQHTHFERKENNYIYIASSQFVLFALPHKYWWLPNIWKNIVFVSNWYLLIFVH